MSAREIALLCKRLKVPLPPKGYWTRQAKKRMVGRPPLLPIQRGELRSVLVRRTDGKGPTPEEQQEAQARAEERRRERHAEAQRRHLDERRWTCLVDLSRQSDEAEQVRRFLSRLEEAQLSPEALFGDHTVAGWLSWAREYVERIDPLAKEAALAYERLAQASAIRPHQHD
ncbi:hypothetical protein [Methylobacterium nigriterrae]|uniref:hypothetical protein n=1 Tax=Methylobacterium nigriterrae TaxID=3127512 RepID=UPI0030140B8A